MALNPKITSLVITLMITTIIGGALYYDHQIKKDVTDIKEQKYIRGIFKNVTEKYGIFCLRCAVVPYLIFKEDGILNTGLETREYEIKKGYIFTPGMYESEYMIFNDNTIVGVSVQTSCCTFKRITQEEFEKGLKSK